MRSLRIRASSGLDYRRAEVLASHDAVSQQTGMSSAMARLRGSRRICGACAGAVVIPVDFSRVFTTTGNVSVQTIFDATDFHVPFRGNVFTLLATTGLFTVVVLGIGYLMSVHIRSQLGASQVALLLTMLPTTMLSGYTFAIDQMPAPIRAISLLVYARYYVTILRSVFLKGSTLADLSVPLAALALYALVIIWLSARAFRKRLD